MSERKKNRNKKINRITHCKCVQCDFTVQMLKYYPCWNFLLEICILSITILGQWDSCGLRNTHSFSFSYEEKKNKQKSILSYIWCDGVTKQTQQRILITIFERENRHASGCWPIAYDAISFRHRKIKSFNKNFHMNSNSLSHRPHIFFSTVYGCNECFTRLQSMNSNAQTQLIKHMQMIQYIWPIVWVIVCRVYCFVSPWNWL